MTNQSDHVVLPRAAVEELEAKAKQQCPNRSYHIDKRRVRRSNQCGDLLPHGVCRWCAEVDALLAAAKPVVKAGVAKVDTDWAGYKSIRLGTRPLPRDAHDAYAVLLIAADAAEEG